jgi:2'-5' RNA ligase
VARELQFPYHPHVTVAHGIDDEAMDRAFEGLADFEAEWPCTGFALYEQGADGVWRKLREYTFGRPTVPPQAGRVNRGTIPSR